MFRNVVIGRYYPTSSIVHRLSALVKVSVSFFLFLAIWVVYNPFLLLVLLLDIVLLILFSKIPLSIFLNMLKGSIVLLCFYNFINLLFGVTLQTIVWINLRVLLSIFLSCLFLFVTPPMEINQAFNYFLKPLNRMGLPVNYITFSIILVFRFFPLVLESTNQIIKALKSSGGNFFGVSWKKKVEYLKCILLPLFYIAFKKSDSYAEVLEVKGFSLEREREYYHKATWENQYWILIFAIIFFVACIFWR